MTDERATLAKIDKCRAINRRAAAKYAEHGVAPIDAAIAAVYSAHDLAVHAGKDPHAAIEWMRTALDIMERNLFEGGTTDGGR